MHSQEKRVYIGHIPSQYFVLLMRDYNFMDYRLLLSHDIQYLFTRSGYSCSAIFDIFLIATKTTTTQIVM